MNQRFVWMEGKLILCAANKKKNEIIVFDMCGVCMQISIVCGQTYQVNVNMCPSIWGRHTFGFLRTASKVADF
jgi:hypothetical protein